jgi:hypothetical protein
VDRHHALRGDACTPGSFRASQLELDQSASWHQCGVQRHARLRHKCHSSEAHRSSSRTAYSCRQRHSWVACIPLPPMQRRRTPSPPARSAPLAASPALAQGGRHRRLTARYRFTYRREARVRAARPCKQHHRGQAVGRAGEQFERAAAVGVEGRG